MRALCKQRQIVSAQHEGFPTLRFASHQTVSPAVTLFRLAGIMTASAAPFSGTAYRRAAWRSCWPLLTQQPAQRGRGCGRFALLPVASHSCTKVPRRRLRRLPPTGHNLRRSSPGVARSGRNFQPSSGTRWWYSMAILASTKASLRIQTVPICSYFLLRERRDSNPRPPT